MQTRCSRRWATTLSLLLLPILAGCCADSGRGAGGGEPEGHRSFEAATPVDLSAEQAEEIGAMLRAGRLAPLPHGAREIRFGSWSGFFSGQGCLVFTASVEEIAAFIEGSASLQGEEPARFGGGRANLPETERGAEIGLGHRYYQPNGVFPWYRPTLRGEGRRFEIPPDPDQPGHNWGEVVVDDDLGRVSVEVTWS